MVIMAPKKELLNSLKCPVCGGQIDIARVCGSNYGCVNNPYHYNLNIETGSVAIFSFLTRERITLYDSKYRYDILRIHGESIKTKIEIFDIDGERRVIFSFKDKFVEIDGDAFDFNNFNSDKALNRIKTILLFQ